jgi:hypothetical protein
MGTALPVPTKFYVCGCIMIIQNQNAKIKVLLLCNIAIMYKLWRLHYWKTLKLVNVCWT